jgi:hypothetical protein
MVFQSNIQMDGDRAKIEEVRPGVYVIANAYQGPYDYFRPPETTTAIPSKREPTENQSDKK